MGKRWITPFVELQGLTTGKRYVYRHIKPSVKPNQIVKCGEVVGDAKKNYGYSTGAHLHLEIYEGKKAIDPLPFLKSCGFIEVQPEAFKR